MSVQRQCPGSLDLSHSRQQHQHQQRGLRVLIATTEASCAGLTNETVRHLLAIRGLQIRLIVPVAAGEAAVQYGKIPPKLLGVDAIPNCDLDSPITTSFSESTKPRHVAAELCEWADLLVLAPLDADTVARFLVGLTGNLLLEILRSWDVSKKIVMTLAMSRLMWENPMTKKQISKIRRKWQHIRALEEPVLWTYEDGREKVEAWDGVVEELVAIVQNQADLANVGRDLEIASTSLSKTGSHRTSRLPPELWTIILEYAGEWELAQRLGVFTTLPIPVEWTAHAYGVAAGQLSFSQKLEWSLLTGTFEDVKRHLSETTGNNQRLTYLSPLSVKLIMRFAMTRVLSHLETAHKDLFWNTFGHTFLPVKASSTFGQVALLEYWRTSPAFLTKEYTVEAIDGASGAGLVHVLDWWYHQSGLPLKYTEAALEQATCHGHIEVLEWWRNTSQNGANTQGAESTSPTTAASPAFLRLKPGKSICYAAQGGLLDVLSWWVKSNIPFQHEDLVAKLASNHGHVAVLDLWKSLRGEKMIFDNQVLVGATKGGHRDVLQWWKRSKLRVEYKTCDIEEALEDGVGGPRGEAVRRWWAENGLNLGVGTSEWMRTKLLN